MVFGESKLKELDRLLEELGPQQVIIWAQYRYEIEAIVRRLAGRAVALYGDTPDKDMAIDAFKDGRFQYLIAHPRSAAHGLTFTNCATAVFYSNSFSLEENIQAKDRIYRIGQNKNCLYIYL